MLVRCAKADSCPRPNPNKCDHYTPHESWSSCGPQGYCGNLDEAVPCLELEVDKRYDVIWE